ncbi:MAG: dihydrolipoamide acetyltransferase family protein [Proteobacteria bacterium]|nr:dihydrolipoamide acetyltransferase family protein [Pseudomonadota bacterium]
MSEALDAVTIPKWGIEMTHGTIVAWHKSVGDAVKAGEDIVDIETDKIVNSFEARSSGILVRLLAGVGDELPVGHLIGVIASEAVEDEAIDAFVAAQSGGGDAAPAVEKTLTDTEAAAPSGAGAATVRIAPALRRKLDAAGIDPSQITGTGPGGRIVKADVDLAIERGATPATPTSGGQPLSSQQATVARKLSQAQSTLPLFHVSMDAQVDEALAMLPDGASVNDLIVAAVQQALVSHPELNQTFDGERLTAVEGQPVGIAVATDANVVLAPVVQTAADAGLEELASHSRELISRARGGQMTASDQTPAAITVSNLGMYGVTAFTAMVTPPQVMVLSVGAVKRMPVFNEAGEVVARSVITLTLGSDHRVVNGAQAAAFLKTVVAGLESS